MDNVLIKFDADTSGLAPAVPLLEQLTQADKDLLEQAKATGKAIGERDKTVTDSAASGKKAIDAFAGSFQNLDKSMLGGAYKQVLQDLRSQLSLTNGQAKTFFENIRTNSRMEIVNGANMEDLEQLTALIAAADEALTELGHTEDQGKEKTKSYRAELRAMREELQRMEDAGQAGTQAFMELAAAAGALQDDIGDTSDRIRAMSSDTFAFDAIISGLTGVAAGFNIASGAAMLFGDENEDLQRALLKVNAAMQILQGLQALSNLIKDQSVAKTGLQVLMNKLFGASTVQTTAALNAQTAATAASTTATTAQTAATATATTATRGLTAAMLANPATALLVVITALAAAVYFFASGADDAEEKQKDFNDRMREANELAVALANSYAQVYKDRTKDAETAVAMAQAAGKSEAEIFKLKQEQLLTKKQEGIYILATLGMTKDDIKYNETLLEVRQEQLRAILDSVDASGELSKQDKAAAERLRGEIARIKGITDAARAAQDSIEEADKQKQVNAAAEQKRLADAGLKSAVGFADARVQLSIKSSHAEFEARRELLTAQLKLELSNVNLTEGEIADIHAKYMRANIELDKQENIVRLQNKKNYIDASLSKTEEGSKEEFVARQKQLEIMKQLELAQADQNESQKAKVIADYARKNLDLIKQYNRKVAEDAVNSQVAASNSLISSLQVKGFQETSAEMVAAKQQLVHEQAQLEILSIQYSKDNEELKRVKIQAVYDKELADKRKLEQDKNNAEIEASSKFFSAWTNLQIAQEENIAKNTKKSVPTRLAAEKNIFELRNKLLDSGYNSEKARLEQGLITQKEFATRELDYFTQKEQLKTQRLESEEQRRLQIQQGLQESAYSLFTTISSGYFSFLSDSYQSDLDEVTALKDKKVITEQEANRRIAEIKRKQAAASKEEAIFNIGLNTAQAIIKNNAQLGFLPAIPINILTFAAGLAQTAFVLAKQPPKYKRGKIRIDGPGTETSDSIHALLSKNESVINAEATRRYEPALRAINEFRFEEYLQSMMPAMPQFNYTPVQAPTWWSNQSSVNIDYDKLGESVAKHVGTLADIPGIDVRVDERGFHAMMRRQNETIEFQNNRYSFKLN